MTMETSICHHKSCCRVEISWDFTQHLGCPAFIATHSPSMTMKKQSPESPYRAGSTSKQHEDGLSNLTHVQHLNAYYGSNLSVYVILTISAVVCKLDFEPLKPQQSQHNASHRGPVSACLMTSVPSSSMSTTSTAGTEADHFIDIRILDRIYPEISGFWWKKQGEKKLNEALAPIGRFSKCWHLHGIGNGHQFVLIYAGEERNLAHPRISTTQKRGIPDVRPKNSI